MSEGLIVARSMGELRKAAAQGQAYYSCERFEDAYGRLIVGIGARLEGRSLQTVVRLGRKKIFVSPVSFSDGMRFRRAFRQADHHEPRDAILEMYETVARMHPEAARRVLALKPQPNELNHAKQVGAYVRRLMTAYNGIQKGEQVTYSKKDLMSGFVAGVVHDIGCWGGCSVRGHAERGAQFLRDLVEGSAWILNLANLIEGHHVKLSECPKDKLLGIAPLVLAEAVVEEGRQVLDSLIDQDVSGQIKNLLICTCNLEQCIPPLCVVRVRNQSRGLGYALAVSLKAETGGFTGPYLLRFAEVDGRGRPRPFPLEYRCLIGPGHPEYEGGELEVIDVLPKALYARLFEAYEGLIPVYRSVSRKIKEGMIDFLF